jgi:hypothetical protein
MWNWRRRRRLTRWMRRRVRRRRRRRARTHQMHEEDDTDPYWSCGDAPEEPPVGFTYAPCPPVATNEDCAKLIGRKVLFAHERTKTLESLVGTWAIASSSASRLRARIEIEPDVHLICPL